jgi:hypothetical protein
MISKCLLYHHMVNHRLIDLIDLTHILVLIDFIIRLYLILLIDI